MLWSDVEGVTLPLAASVPVAASLACSAPHLHVRGHDRQSEVAGRHQLWGPIHMNSYHLRTMPLPTLRLCDQFYLLQWLINTQP
jgi:hypothetical protein